MKQSARNKFRNVTPLGAISLLGPVAETPATGRRVRLLVLLPPKGHAPSRSSHATLPLHETKRLSDPPDDAWQTCTGMGAIAPAPHRCGWWCAKRRRCAMQLERFRTGRLSQARTPAHGGSCGHRLSMLSVVLNSRLRFAANFLIWLTEPRCSIVSQFY